MADPFPLYLPSEARRLFQSESLLRRFAQAAHFTGGSRLLEVHASLGGLALTRALNCTLTVVEPDAKVADTLKERARLAGLGDKVTWLVQPLSTVSFAAKSFDGIFSLGLTGALLAPALLGFAAHFWGIGTIMWLPLFGSLAVSALVLAIWLEARLSRG
jgi:hypothetical protein